MQFRIISWNIRHFRKAKIEDYIYELHSICSWGHVAFIYEDHTGLGSRFAAAMNAFEQEMNKHRDVLNQYTANRWAGSSFQVQDEYVTCIWLHGSITLEQQGGLEKQVQRIISGERAPAVVKIEGGGSSLVLAAWHAFGPAKVSAKDLFTNLLKISFLDVLIGDFNFQTFDPALRPGRLVLDDSTFSLSDSLDFEVPPTFAIAAGAVSTGHRSARIRATYKMQEILPSNHSGSTTFTEDGPGRRTTGLDRCVVASALVGTSELRVARPIEFDEVITLTDHVALMLVVEK